MSTFSTHKIEVIGSDASMAEWYAAATKLGLYKDGDFGHDVYAGETYLGYFCNRKDRPNSCKFWMEEAGRANIVPDLSNLFEQWLARWPDLLITAEEQYWHGLFYVGKQFELDTSGKPKPNVESKTVVTRWFDNDMFDGKIPNDKIIHVDESYEYYDPDRPVEND